MCAMRYKSLADLLNEFHKARVLVLGDVMLDRFVYGSVERISPEAPIPVMSVERISDMPGGAANVARNIAALGAQCVLLGVVGADGKVELRRVALGRDFGPTIEILGGVGPTDRVILNPADSLVGGTTVRVAESAKEHAGEASSAALGTK